MQAPIITLEDVSYAYPNSTEWALRKINLSIREGEFLAVMGENDSGKTTLCRLFNGIIPHSQGGSLRGKVTVDGILTRDSSVPALARVTGMALDDPEAQLFTAAVRDEVASGPENLLLPPEEIEKRVKLVLEMTGLAEYADAAPASLSGGQKQRLAIAAALALAGKVLVLDEPASQLDSAAAAELLPLIRKIREGLTVIMATHNSEEAAALADRICVLKNGKLAACDAPQVVFGNRALLEESGIRPPAVSALAASLREKGAAFSQTPALLEEAAAAIREWYVNRRRS
jgi:energy-coupling factor transporter ATP-binding protein EcfA2